MEKLNMHIISTTLPGTYHLARGQENEDCIVNYQDDRIIAAAVSDGCSSSPYALVASTATCQAAIAFAKDPKIWGRSNGVIKTGAIKNLIIHYLDEAYSNCDAPFPELQATLSMVVVNRISRHAIAVSIGDCAILTLDDKLKNPAILHTPTNPVNKQSTIFANAESAKFFSKVTISKLDDVGAFTLISDGAGQLLEKGSSNIIKKLGALTVYDPDYATLYLKELAENFRDGGHDDVSIIQLSVVSEETLAQASKYIPNTIAENPEEVLVETEVPEEDTATPSDMFQGAPETSNAAEAPIGRICAMPLLEFLSTPRSAEEIVMAGFVAAPEELLVYLRPFLQSDIIRYAPHHGFYRTESEGNVS